VDVGSDPGCAEYAPFDGAGVMCIELNSQSSASDPYRPQGSVAVIMQSGVPGARQEVELSDSIILIKPRDALAPLPYPSLVGCDVPGRGYVECACNLAYTDDEQGARTVRNVPIGAHVMLKERTWSGAGPRTHSLVVISGVTRVLWPPE
jgi:hypothetical protein